jgi:tRNA1(Val) A37 N6-methylase TrmN6
MPLTNTTNDRLLNGRVHLRQPVNGYRAGIDSVLLAAAVPAEPGQTAIDVGAGVGAAALCLAVRVADLAMTGIELDPEQVQIAAENALATGVAERVRFVGGDILGRPSLAAADQVLTNPPYLTPGAATPPPDASRARAHVGGSDGLAAWLGGCLRLLKPGGTLTLIHRADALPDALASLPGCGAIEVLPLWPGDGKPAKRVVLRARKGSRAGLTLHPGLVLHRPDGSYTEAAEAILRHGATLPAGCGQ